MNSLLRYRRPILQLAAMGATLGVLLDAIHSHFGATSYTNPIVAQTAWWVPPLFAAAYAGGITRPILEPSPRIPDWKPALSMGIFIVAYWLTVAPIASSSRIALLIALFATSLRLCDPTRAGLIVATTGAILGPTVEILLVNAGTFVHHEAHWQGIPAWLPFLYLNAGVGLGCLATWLVQRR